MTFVSLVVVMPLVPVLSAVLRLLVLGTSCVGAAVLCQSFQSVLSQEQDPVWASVLVNGWQSFSYAGYLPLDSCFGVFGALRRVLCKMTTVNISLCIGAFSRQLNGLSHAGKKPSRPAHARGGMRAPSWNAPENAAPVC